MNKYAVTWRDQVVWWLASQILRLGTKKYRAFIYVVVQLGLQEIDRRFELDDPST